MHSASARQGPLAPSADSAPCSPPPLDPPTWTGVISIERLERYALLTWRGGDCRGGARQAPYHHMGPPSLRAASSVWPVAPTRCQPSAALHMREGSHCISRRWSLSARHSCAGCPPPSQSAAWSAAAARGQCGLPCAVGPQGRHHPTATVSGSEHRHTDLGAAPQTANQACSSRLACACFDPPHLSILLHPNVCGGRKRLHSELTVAISNTPPAMKMS